MGMPGWSECWLRIQRQSGPPADPDPSRLQRYGKKGAAPFFFTAAATIQTQFFERPSLTKRGLLGRKQRGRASMGCWAHTQGHLASVDLFSGTNRGESNALFSFHSRQGQDRGPISDPGVWSNLEDFLKFEWHVGNMSNTE